MAQSSGPLTNQPFTDQQWRSAIGAEPGITGDVNGSAYSITLANNSDVASVGSTSQESHAIVGGFPHVVPPGQPEGVTIPAPTSADRTDLIVLRYDPTWGAVEPGPVRLFRIAGTEGAGLPTYDASPPGVEDLPLWAVTRTVGPALSQATVVDLRTWTGPNLLVREVLPTSAPLGTQAFVTTTRLAFVRVLDDQQSPTWRPLVPENTRADSVLNRTSPGGDFTVVFSTPFPAGTTYTVAFGDTNITPGIGAVHWKVWGKTVNGFNARAVNPITGAIIAGFTTTVDYTATARR